MAQDVLHPRLAAILANAPAYYNAVADAYSARKLSGGFCGTNGDMLADAFYSVDGCPAGLVDSEPSRGERMLILKLARLSRV